MKVIAAIFAGLAVLFALLLVSFGGSWVGLEFQGLLNKREAEIQHDTFTNTTAYRQANMKRSLRQHLTVAGEFGFGYNSPSRVWLRRREAQAHSTESRKGFMLIDSRAILMSPQRTKLGKE